ncbi:nucleotidyltransferase family protein [Spirosoma daeguense]
MRIATIILAAGSSSRLGNTPKQLLKSEGKTLIRRIAETALSLNTGPIVVVVGANQEQLLPELAGLPVLVADNQDWQEGMASSLRSGLHQLDETTIDAFIVVLTDQPYVTADLLHQLLTTYQESGKGIVACQYGKTNHLGVPALFSLKYKTEFMQLSGDVGARKLIQQYTDDCASVTFPLATVDLDTWEDVANWQNR